MFICRKYNQQNSGRKYSEFLLLKKINTVLLCTIMCFTSVGNAFASSNNCLDVYYVSESHNFGDKLNEDLLNYFSIKFNRVPVDKAENIFIGSTLGWGYSEKINAFGVGFIQEPSKSYNFPKGINCYCLRGKKTKECVQKITGKKLDDCLLGDPGLLCKEIFPMDEKKIYDVGIVCHQYDKNSPYLKNINLSDMSYTFININDETEKVCKKINQCKFILSSAMHALIVCDSYGIPNRRIILADSNNPRLTRCNFKFDDYYSIYDEVVPAPQAVDLKYTSISDKDIDIFKDQYNIPQDIISEFCKNYKALINNYFSNVCPMDDGVYNICSKLAKNMVLI